MKNFYAKHLTEKAILKANVIYKLKWKTFSLFFIQIIQLKTKMLKHNWQYVTLFLNARTEKYNKLKLYKKQRKL